MPAQWYEVPAYYKGIPDTVIGPGTRSPGRPTRSARLRARARRRHRPTGRSITPHARAATSSAGRSGTTCRRATRRAASCRSAWARARPRTGTARTSSARASSPPTSSTASDAAMILRVNGEELRRARSSQMHHTFDALIAYASHAVRSPRRGARIGHRTGWGRDRDRPVPHAGRPGRDGGRRASAILSNRIGPRA